MRRRILSAAIVLASTSQAAFAAGAHVHGQGNLDIAVEEGRVDMFLTAPLGDVAGDEGSDAAALETRFSSPELFAFAGASCQRTGFSVEITTIGEDDAESFFTDAESDHDGDEEHDHHEDHGDHDEEHDHHEEHGDHGDEHEEHGDHDEDHDHHESHGDHDEAHSDHEGHHDEDDHSGHKDARMNWVYECDGDPASITANLFDLARVERIAVQAVSTGGVESIELTADAKTLTLR